MSHFDDYSEQRLNVVKVGFTLEQSIFVPVFIQMELFIRLDSITKQHGPEVLWADSACPDQTAHMLFTYMLKKNTAPT